MLTFISKPCLCSKFFRSKFAEKSRNFKIGKLFKLLLTGMYSEREILGSSKKFSSYTFTHFGWSGVDTNREISFPFEHLPSKVE